MCSKYKISYIIFCTDSILEVIQLRLASVLEIVDDYSDDDDVIFVDASSPEIVDLTKEEDDTPVTVKNFYRLDTKKKVSESKEESEQKIDESDVSLFWLTFVILNSSLMFFLFCSG